MKRCDHDPLAVPFAESLIDRLIEHFRNGVGCSEHKDSCTLFTRQKRKRVLKASFAVRPPRGGRNITATATTITPFPQGVASMPSPRVGRVSFAGIDRSRIPASLPPEWEPDADCRSAAAAKKAQKRSPTFQSSRSQNSNKNALLWRHLFSTTLTAKVHEGLTAHRIWTGL